MQQVNLYLPEFRPKRDPLRTIHIVWGLAAFLLLLCAFSIFSVHNNKLALQNLLAEQQSVNAMQVQVQKLLAQKPTQSAVELDAQIEKLQKDLQHRRDVLATLSNRHLGNDKGFSAQLTQLAQAALNAVSIDRFSLQYGGSYAEMSGRTRSADLIPLYLQRLQADESFAQVGFGVLQVARDKKDASLLRFSITKAVSEANKEDKDAVATLMDLNEAADQRAAMNNSSEANSNSESATEASQ